MTYPASVIGSVVSYLEGEGMNAMADAVHELKAENNRLRADRDLWKYTAERLLSEQRGIEQSAGQGDPQMGN